VIQVTNDVATSKSGTASGSLASRSSAISAGLSSAAAFVSDVGSVSETGNLGFAELADRLAVVGDTQFAAARESTERLGHGLTAVLEAVHRIRLQTSPAEVLQQAPRELCASATFDRVMLSHIRGSTWLPRVLYAKGPDGQVGLEIDGIVEELEIPLSSPLVEAEAVRRRLPALVQDAAHEPRVFRPLVERTGTREYVVAPVVAGSSVIGLLHADAAVTGRALGGVDRDLLRMFADGVGLVYERACLSELVDEQRRMVTEVCKAAVRSLREFDAGPALSAHADMPRPVPPASRDRTAPRESDRLSRLTAREREVLALLASGATNAQLADRLTVAESTVKSHVKHILHKLGASNRAAAIACYLRESRADERRPR
jgi:DNA-binding CsgD family transcriptional regulator